MNIYIYVYVYVCMYVYMYVCMYACISACMYICTYVFTYIQTNIHTYIHACMHTYIHTSIHACIHTYIHIGPGGVHTLIYSRMCNSYWQGGSNCNFISARNLVKFLSPSVLNLGFGPFRFDICMLCLSMCFFRSVFIQRLLCATVDQ